MKFERPTDLTAVEDLEGTIIIPKEDGEYPEKAFQLHYDHQRLTNHRGLLQDLLMQRGDDYTELNLEALALLIWEHRQYCEAQEFSVSTVRIHRVVQELSKEQERIFPRDIKGHPLTDEYSSQTIRNGLGKLVTEGFLEEGEHQGEYHYIGASQYVTPDNLLPLNDFEGRLTEEQE